MSLWAKAQHLPAESFRQIRAIYGDHFPIEVRHYLAQYIEEHFCLELDPISGNSQHEQYVANLVCNFITEIENKAMVVTDSEYFLTKLKLAEAAEMFQKRYSENPMELFTYIRQCLNTEMNIIQTACGDDITEVVFDFSSGAEVLLKLEILRIKTQSIAEDLKKLDQLQEAYALQYHEYTKIKDYLQQTTGQSLNADATAFVQKLQNHNVMLEKVLNEKVTELMQLRSALEENLKESVELTTQLQVHILQELTQWKRDQQLAANGATFNSGHLDTIQEWCESSVEMMWLSKQQIKEFTRLKEKLFFDIPGTVDVLPQLYSNITELLTSLANSAFVVEKQPPQVMKINTKFAATVRLLVGGKLNVHMTPPQVKVNIVSEAQVQKILEKKPFGVPPGEILNNVCTMDYQKATRQLSANFRNLQLKNFKRTEKKGTDSVMDGKFCLLFESQFSVGGGQLVFRVSTLSLPVVVIVHGTQEHHAWATITWDNAFSEPGRTLFAVPDRVPWTEMAKTLSQKFKAATSRALTEDNLKFLSEKALRNNLIDPSSAMISWTQYCKETLPEGNFTFWEWFYAAMKLTREHFQQIWDDGHIMGFVKKQRAEELLSLCLCGTFLIRFSDTQLGGITIAWKSETGEVYSLRPFTYKNLIKPFADVIADFKYLVYLYPDIPKDVAFRKYYTSSREDAVPPSKNGYVKYECVFLVPGFTGQNPNNTLQQVPSTSAAHQDTTLFGTSDAGSLITTTDMLDDHCQINFFEPDANMDGSLITTTNMIDDICQIDFLRLEDNPDLTNALMQSVSDYSLISEVSQGD